jgi:NDP-sugar pyrophosphorylase family protein
MTSVTGTDFPKALMPVAGRPFIDVKLAGLADEGVERVVLLLGHGDRLITEHVGSNRYGLEVTCLSDGPVLLGTGGAVRKALDHLGDVFWLTYGDTYLRAPMGPIEVDFQARGTEGLMTVLRNRDRWDRSNVRVEEGLVVEYEKGARAGTYEYIDYGLAIMRRVSFEPFSADSPFDVDEVFHPTISRRQMAAYRVTRRFYEIGSPQGYRETDRFLRRSGEWRNLI